MKWRGFRTSAIALAALLAGAFWALWMDPTNSNRDHISLGISEADSLSPRSERPAIVRSNSSKNAESPANPSSIEVLDEDREPIPLAAAHATNGSTRFLRRADVLGSWQADQSGTIRLPVLDDPEASWEHVVVSARGFQSTFLTIRGREEAVQIILRKAKSLRIEVVDVEGSAVADCDVRVTAEPTTSLGIGELLDGPASGSPEAAIGSATDNQGLANFDQLGERVYILEAIKPGYSVLAFDPGQSVDLRFGDGSVRIVMCRIFAAVLRAGDDEIRGLRTLELGGLSRKSESGYPVRALAYWRQTLKDRFPDSVVIAALEEEPLTHSPPRGKAMAMLARSGVLCFEFELAPVTLITSSQEVYVANANLPEPGELRIRVRDRDGVVHTPLQVRIWMNAVTAEDGQPFWWQESPAMDIRVPPGEYRVAVMDKFIADQMKPAAFHIDSGARTEALFATQEALRPVDLQFRFGDGEIPAAIFMSMRRSQGGGSAWMTPHPEKSKFLMSVGHYRCNALIPGAGKMNFEFSIDGPASTQEQVLRFLVSEGAVCQQQ